MSNCLFEQRFQRQCVLRHHTQIYSDWFILSLRIRLECAPKIWPVLRGVLGRLFYFLKPIVNIHSLNLGTCVVARIFLSLSFIQAVLSRLNMFVMVRNFQRLLGITTTTSNSRYYQSNMEYFNQHTVRKHLEAYCSWIF